MTYNTFFGRLLCKIGQHNWTTTSEVNSKDKSISTYYSTHRCERCNANGFADHYYGDGSIYKE